MTINNHVTYVLHYPSKGYTLLLLLAAKQKICFLVWVRTRHRGTEHRSTNCEAKALTAAVVFCRYNSQFNIDY